jgi:hypothetical protein
MSYAAAIRMMPPELQPAMVEFVEALDEDFRERYAVRRQDFEALQAVVQDLVEAQGRTEQRVAELAEAQQRTEQRVAELAEAQQRTEQRVAELAEAQRRTEQRVAELAEAQQRSEERLGRLETALAELAAAQQRTDESLERLIKRVDKMDVSLNDLRGWRLEHKYKERAFGYFGRILRRAKAVDVEELLCNLEAHLSADELEDVSLLDVLVRGQYQDAIRSMDIWLALEISAVIDARDVERAGRHAQLLRKAGYAAVPAVAGEQITEGALVTCELDKVLLVRNGHRMYWPEALDHVLER